MHPPPTHTIINLIEYLDIKQDLAVDVTNNCDFEVNKEQPGGELQDRCEEIPECYSRRQETCRRFPEPGRDDGYIAVHWRLFSRSGRDNWSEMQYRVLFFY